MQSLLITCTIADFNPNDAGENVTVKEDEPPMGIGDAGLNPLTVKSLPVTVIPLIFNSSEPVLKIVKVCVTLALVFISPNSVSSD